MQAVFDYFDRVKFWMERGAVAVIVYHMRKYHIRMVAKREAKKKKDEEAKKKKGKKKKRTAAPTTATTLQPQKPAAAASSTNLAATMIKRSDESPVKPDSKESLALKNMA